MRIAFFVRQFPCVSETFILRQITGLLDLGHDVRVYSHLPPDGEPVHEAVESHALIERTTYICPVVPARGRAARNALGVTRLLVRDPAALTLLRRERAAPFGGRRSLLPRLRALAYGGGYDVVHCHFGDVALSYQFTAFHWRAPLVVSFYGGYDVTRIPRQRGADVYVPLFERSAAVTALGDRMAEDLRSLGCPAEKIRKVPLSVDISEFVGRRRSPNPMAGPVRLLSVARLVEMKGIEYGLRALAAVRKEGPERALRYDVVGDGPLRSPLELLARELGVADLVEFHGSMGQGDVRRLMSEADIFLLPSVTAANGDQEGTPTVLMEASSCEVPVLSTLHSGIPEVVLDGESGFLVPERDVEALAEGLEKLVRDPELRASFGRAGRDHVRRHFNYTVVSRRLEELYVELVERERDED